MLGNFSNLFNRQYVPLNKIEINKKALISNYNYLSSINKNIKIAPVLKSNAYGHGLVQIAQILDQLNPPMFCVDSLFEAYELLKAGVKSEILIMGYIHPQSLKVKKLPFAYAIFSEEQLEVINEFQKGAKVHLKVDTGMHRLGIPMDQFEGFVKKMEKCSNVRIDGLMSHIAYQEDPSNKLSKLQLTSFQKAQNILEKYGDTPSWFHLSASEFFLKSKASKASKIGNLVRCGLALYGINPTQNHKNLKPILKVTSQIVQIKKLKKGEKVGYSGTFEAKENMVLGVLPIGYNDGVDRRLSNIGTVKVQSKDCRITGLVSMNITVIDLSAVKNPKVGDKVTIFSQNPNDPNSVQNSAFICGTIPYELLIHLSPTSIRRHINP